jgi:hypothetical protein
LQQLPNVPSAAAGTSSACLLFVLRIIFFKFLRGKGKQNNHPHDSPKSFIFITAGRRPAENARLPVTAWKAGRAGRKSDLRRAETAFPRAQTQNTR